MLIWYSMFMKMDLLKCRLSALRSKWAALQFSYLRSIDVIDYLTMDK
jgi:hypothetical protein